MDVRLPEFADVMAAGQTVRGAAVTTPLLRHDMLDAVAGAPVFVKAECLQTTGSFKIRGATNFISKLSDSVRQKGIVAYSSGNHAQGVAAAARRFGVSATIVMPSDAPKAKVDGVKRLGGTVVPYERGVQSREDIAARICAETGAALAPSYDHFDIIAGQGTAGLECHRQLDDLGVKADTLCACLGGGGLIAGIGLVFKTLSPDTALYGVEPEGFDDHKRSLASSQIEHNDRETGSICDAILTPQPGQLTFALNKRQLSGVATVSDDEALRAMAFAMKYLKIVAEPGGAVALAAVLAGKIKSRTGGPIVVMVTGGNVDEAVIQRALTRGPD